MNWINQIKRFYQDQQTKSVSSKAITVYNTLLYINNSCGWAKEFTVANVTLQSLSSLSRPQLHKARNELKQKGFIDYKKGSGNQAGTYLIVDFDTQMNTQMNTQFDTQFDTQLNTQLNTQSDIQMAHINKTKTKTKLNNNKKENNKEKSFDEIIDEYTEDETLRYELREHLKIRKAKKATLTPHAIELSLKTLDKLTDDMEEKIQIVRTSIQCGWTGFFAPKKNNSQVKASSDELFPGEWETL